MARPSKPLALVQGHRTKAEIETRKKGEASVLTGVRMKEFPSTKNDPVAHKYFLRIRKLYKAIEKDDALSEVIVNRYCMMLSECERYEEKDAKLQELMEGLMDRQTEMEYTDYIKLQIDLNKQIQKNDSLLQSKRRLLLSIEKESLMTFASQLRSIPKKPDDKKPSNMAKFLAKRSGAGG